SLYRRNQTVAPVERRRHRAVSLRACAASSQETQSIVELLEQPTHTEYINPRRGEFDRQRKTVEPPTDFGDHWRFGIVERERFEPLGRPVDEELNGRELKGFFRGQARRRRWRVQPRQIADAFPLDPKRLSAGDDALHTGGVRQNAIRTARHRVDNVLAT